MEMSYTERMSIGLRAAEYIPGTCQEQMIPMRDGVRLRTLFYMPDTTEPCPILFTRSPYPKNQEIYDYQGKIFTERGYGFVIQYCRGTGGSEGEWAPFENEKEDGTDALKWLQEQDWIGNIGLYGFSYAAYTQWVVLDRLVPKVKTAYIVHFGTDRYRQMYSDGLFRHDIYTPWAKDNSGTGRKLPYEKALEAGRYKPHVEADREVWEMDLPWYRDWITHPDYDDPFWKNSFWEDLKGIPGKINIPVFLGCGWYDHHFGGMQEGYHSLSDYAKKHSRMVIGPWVHNKEECIDAKDTSDAFREGTHGYEEALRWMDRCLKQEEIPDSEVQVYNIGKGWEKKDSWPVCGTEKRFWFAENGLSETAPAETSALKYVYDPSDIIETEGAECMCYAPLAKRGSRLQMKEGSRSDVITLTSMPLDKELVISGVVKAHLNVSTDVEDTAFIVRLMEERADGNSYNIRTGAATLRYRNGSEKALSYTPGEQVSVDFRLWDILWTIPAGSKIRLDISSVSFPEYNIHLNTADPWALQKDAVTAQQSVWIGCDGSYIDIACECGTKQR